ncbi:hypothetical protein L1987_17788 [Smallanthus sonchifolius]|uniref:Uncharacterized protein n=1 Tax=Smallanthus sonchifolius TaxID=185202 RepID=A0ACB9J1D8_9ASTR|nr:hypothetical protein L1987_17788 [Smallanthus sonchifolius]
MTPVVSRKRFATLTFIISSLSETTDKRLSVSGSSLHPLKYNQAYAVVKNSFVIPEDVLAQQIVVQKSSARGVHFRRAGSREKVYFKPEEVRACIVTCGGLCPGINTLIREIVCGLNYVYGVNTVLGIEVGHIIRALVTLYCKINA